MTTEILKRSLFAQGQRLFKAGDPPVCAYLIKSGQVDIVMERDGQEVCVSAARAARSAPLPTGAPWTGCEGTMNVWLRGRCGPKRNPPKGRGGPRPSRLS